MTPPYQDLRASDDVTVRRGKIQRRSVKDLCQLGGPRVKSRVSNPLQSGIARRRLEHDCLPSIML
jgi:hypothetical protein